ncbi:MAG: cytochrome c biogenesis CcdA family protein [Acidimicrobiales bacterium]
MNAVLALALAAGMVGAINPCGFALLPAYIGFFVTRDTVREPPERRLLRAMASAAMVTSGFVVVFVLLGVALESVVEGIRPHLPWVTVAAGALIVLSGMAVAAGRRIPLPAPAVRALGGRSPLAVFGYGMVYALASLSCTIGPFLAITAVALDQSFLGGVAAHMAYAAGMGSVIFVLAAGAALARPEPTRHLRRISRYAPRLGGMLMILSGGYAIWYGRWELTVYRGDLSDDLIVDAGERFRLSLVQFIERIGAARLGLLVALVVASVLAISGYRQITAAPSVTASHHPAAPERPGSGVGVRKPGLRWAAPFNICLSSPRSGGPGTFNSQCDAGRDRKQLTEIAS